jgi:pyoverdine/dityrosine biosynthesis protein Dit1
MGTPFIGLPELLPVSDANTVAIQLLEIVYRQRRLIHSNDSCLHTPCALCLKMHSDKIAKMVAQGSPVTFILPAFPAKSPNLSKVLGTCPDLGEQLSLRQLNDLCLKIGKLYSPGARIIICSDGRAFSDCVGVSDEEVSNYGQEIKNILISLQLNNIDIFNLEDYFKEGDFDDIRQKLVNHYGRSIEELKLAIKTEAQTMNLFNGIHRFMYTDLKARQPDASSNQLKEQSKHLAYEVIIRSNAWSALVQEVFPETIRLSIHPQHPHSEKIGIKLMDCDNIWRTPWHGAVLDDGQNYRLMARSDIEKMPVNLVYENGRPSYYVLRRYDSPEAS